MAELNNAGFTGSGSPTINYKVTYSVKSDGGYNITVTSWMNNSGSFFGTGYSLAAKIVCGS